MKKYQVLMLFRYPAWDEKNGYTYEVTAKSKTEACKFARRNSENDGHSGARYFTATELIED